MGPLHAATFALFNSMQRTSSIMAPEQRLIFHCLLAFRTAAMDF